MHVVSSELEPCATKGWSSRFVPVSTGCTIAIVVPKLLKQPTINDGMLSGHYVYGRDINSYAGFNKQAGRHMPKLVTYIHPCSIFSFAITSRVQQTHR